MKLTENERKLIITALRGATLADVWSATKNCTGCVSQPGVVSPFGPVWEGDNFHPSDLGHQTIAQTIYEAIGLTNHTYLPGVTNK